MSDRRVPGSARVTRRAVAEIVRAAVLESYGVTGLSDADLAGRVRRWLGLGSSGVRVDLRDGISVELFVTVAYGVPVAEVVRQVESAVRYALRRALGRELDALVVHVGGLDYRPGVQPAPAPPPSPRADAGPLLAAAAAADEPGATTAEGEPGDGARPDGAEVDA
ncbi:MAG: Asp23/Gls24 family envelope stress response protein [Chloroflexi bacterium]|jgi:uncharacterized alkaline shock family protein YloU|nr:Asp23/Gls24 family envelope stress response protein [Chloroflexota bacterium]